MIDLEQRTARRTVEAEWTVREAVEAGDLTTLQMEADTEAIMHIADERAEGIRGRIASMARAAAALETAAEHLAATTQRGAAIIDIAAVGQLDQTEFLTPDRTVAVEPAFVLDDQPLKVVAEPAQDAVAEDAMPRTRYQRSTGVPLRERIKIARMSG